MQLDVEEGQFAAIDTDGSGKIEYEEFAIFTAEQGMQQTAQAFAAGWCALQGNDSLVLLEELERMGLTEALAAAKKCAAAVEGGVAAAALSSCAGTPARWQKVESVRNGDAFGVSENDSATNRESITILHQSASCIGSSIFLPRIRSGKKPPFTSADTRVPPSQLL